MLRFSRDGMLDIEAMVPDTITDWVASAFALNTRTGVGIVEEPANVSKANKMHT